MSQQEWNVGVEQVKDKVDSWRSRLFVKWHRVVSIPRCYLSDTERLLVISENESVCRCVIAQQAVSLCYMYLAGNVGKLDLSIEEYYWGWLKFSLYIHVYRCSTHAFTCIHVGKLAWQNPSQMALGFGWLVNASGSPKICGQSGPTPKFGESWDSCWTIRL